MGAKDGKPCKRCGSSEWYKNGNCAPCAREATKKWQRENPEKHNEKSRRWLRLHPDKERERSARRRLENPEKARASVRKWQRENPEKAKANKQKWQRENPEKMREASARWARENPEKHRAKDHRRNTRKTNAGGSYTVAEWKSLIDHYGNKCPCCGRDDVKLTADHIIPVSKGGTSNIDNIQPLCLPCNASKGDKTIDYRPKLELGRWIQRKLL